MLQDTAFNKVLSDNSVSCLVIKYHVMQWLIECRSHIFRHPSITIAS
jgi:hypothetical protein